MWDKPFYSEPEDKWLSITFKREANIILASLKKDSPEYTSNYYKFKKSLEAVKAIERTEPQHKEDIDDILNIINTVWKKDILSPLTLKDDEFSDFDVNGVANNLRYYNICKSNKIDSNGNYVIYNRNAYKAIVRKQYDYDTNQQAGITKADFILSPTIYINKGGRLTGEQVCLCRIRPEIVNNHCYTIQSTVNIPVSAIYGKEIGVILTVDHREPKLKVLNEFYEVMTGQDNRTIVLNMDIRKFKKL